MHLLRLMNSTHQQHMKRLLSLVSPLYYFNLLQNKDLKSWWFVSRRSRKTSRYVLTLAYVLYAFIQANVSNKIAVHNLMQKSSTQPNKLCYVWSNNWSRLCGTRFTSGWLWSISPAATAKQGSISRMSWHRKSTTIDKCLVSNCSFKLSFNRWLRSLLLGKRTLYQSISQPVIKYWCLLCKGCTSYEPCNYDSVLMLEALTVGWFIAFTFNYTGLRWCGTIGQTKYCSTQFLRFTTLVICKVGAQC